MNEEKWYFDLGKLAAIVTSLVMQIPFYVAFRPIFETVDFPEGIHITLGHIILYFWSASLARKRGKLDFWTDLVALNAVIFFSVVFPVTGVHQLSIQFVIGTIYLLFMWIMIVAKKVETVNQWTIQFFILVTLTVILLSI